MSGPDPRRMSPAMREDYERMKRQMDGETEESALLPFSGEEMYAPPDPNVPYEEDDEEDDHAGAE